MENVKKFEEILKGIKPEDVKEKAKELDFLICNFKSPEYTLGIEIKMNRDRFGEILDDNIDEEKIERIERNLKRYFSNLNENKQKDLLRLPNANDYFMDSVSGTAAVLPFQPPDFLESGGIIYPNYEKFLKGEVKSRIPESRRSQTIEIRGNNNIVTFNIGGSKEPKKNWFIEHIKEIIIGIIVFIVGSLILNWIL